jgi:hypothetical protein
MPTFPTNDIIVPSRAFRNPSAKGSTPSGPEKRRGVRLNSRVPIAVEWGAGKDLIRGEAQTRIVGPYGCMAVLEQSLDVEQRIQIINLITSKTNAAVIVWRGHQGAEGWELGIELIDPDMNFWGLDL